MSVIDKIEQTAKQVDEARTLNKKMQNKYKVSSPEWHLHEALDDKLYEAIRLLTQ